MAKFHIVDLKCHKTRKTVIGLKWPEIVLLMLKNLHQMFTFMVIDENITQFFFYLKEKYKNKHDFGFVVTRPENRIL